MFSNIAVDGNGHVNNAVIVQWMQDFAVLHADSFGGANKGDRSRVIDYLRLETKHNAHKW